LTVISVTGFMGALVLAIIIFKIIPSAQRLTFIVAGLTGGMAGYVLWLVVFGKCIMP
jgi:hypothetical protein